MYKKLITLLLLTTICFAKETRKKVVILDTGITKDFPSEYLCSEGSKDFSGLGLEDTIHHGTHLAYIISEYIDVKKECIIAVKFYDDQSLLHSSGLLDSLNYILTLHPDYINMSFGGSLPDIKEKHAIHQLLNQGAIISVASGNSANNLSFYCNYYPACYAFQKNFYVVASCKDGKYSSFSNYKGPVNSCENGEKVQAGPYIFSGTSQATAIKTGKLIKKNRK